MSLSGQPVCTSCWALIAEGKLDEHHAAVHPGPVEVPGHRHRAAERLANAAWAYYRNPTDAGSTDYFRKVGIELGLALDAWKDYA